MQDNEVQIEDGHISWTGGSASLETAIKTLFGVDTQTKICSNTFTERGKSKTHNSLALTKDNMSTIPFNFLVAHNLDGRTLSIIHPRNQVAVANFYAKYKALIMYYASVSDFSIRSPVSVSRFVNFDDKLHKKMLKALGKGIELEDKEYKQIGSYFVYKEFSNIHRFFESDIYHQCEKKYDAMLQVDITKCFDSIYTHSITWAIIGKQQTKLNIAEANTTFAGQFDKLMQRLNHNETNGIVIGPEFSRIFAEIILQSIDRNILNRLNKKPTNLKYKIDFEVFRYVDDYFIFYNLPSTKNIFIEILQDELKAYKLSINTTKIKEYQKPIITEITVAKDRISTLMDAEITSTIKEHPHTAPDKPAAQILVCDIKVNRLILKYKTIIKETGVEYSNLLNYTFSIVERKLYEILQLYQKSDKSQRTQKCLLSALLAMLEFCFFTYSASPKVNHTIRICRIISTSVTFIKLNKLPYEQRHLLFKYIYDNIMHQLEKNTMSAYLEVESLYLLIAISQIGEEYFIPEATLLKHFHISKDTATNTYKRAYGFLNHRARSYFLS